MNLYYIIGRLRESPQELSSPGRLEKSLEQDNSQETSAVQSRKYETIEYKKPNTNSQITSSIPRTNLTLPKYYKKIKELYALKQEYTDRRTRAAINSQIKLQKNKPLRLQTNVIFKKTQGKGRKIHDLEGNLIGTFYKSNKQGREKHLNLGNTEYVSTYSFRIGMKKNNELCLITTAYLNESGIEVLRGYIKKQLKRKEQQVQRRDGGTGKLRGSSKVKSRLRNRNTFDIEMEGINIHLDQKGKIEIMYDYPNLKNILQNGQELSDKQKARLGYFSRYSPVKKWIYNTTNEFNKFAGEKLEELSIAANEILVEKTPALIYY